MQTKRDMNRSQQAQQEWRNKEPVDGNTGRATLGYFQIQTSSNFMFKILENRRKPANLLILIQIRPKLSMTFAYEVHVKVVKFKSESSFTLHYIPYSRL